MTPSRTDTADIKEQITYCVLNSMSGETDPYTYMMNVIGGERYRMICA